jgi:RHS repeat-associated protein
VKTKTLGIILIVIAFSIFASEIDVSGLKPINNTENNSSLPNNTTNTPSNESNISNETIEVNVTNNTLNDTNTTNPLEINITNQTTNKANITNESNISNETPEVNVTNDTLMCSDSTLYGKCSEERPLYCAETLELIEDCWVCGCNKKEICNKQGKCVEKEKKPPKDEDSLGVNTKTTLYIYGNNQLVASVDKYKDIKYYHSDHLGNIKIITNEDGDKIDEEENQYLAFGEPLYLSSNSSLSYNTKEYDESDLYYYGARYYDSFLGRFTTIDPFKGRLETPQSLNKYVYTLNNPMKYVDPDGREAIIHSSLGKDRKKMTKEIVEKLEKYIPEVEKAFKEYDVLITDASTVGDYIQNWMKERGKDAAVLTYKDLEKFQIEGTDLPAAHAVIVLDDSLDTMQELAAGVGHEICHFANGDVAGDEKYKTDENDANVEKKVYEMLKISGFSKEILKKVKHIQSQPIIIPKESEKDTLTEEE